MNMKRIYERRFIFMGTQENDLKCYIVKDKISKEDYYYNDLSKWKDAYVQNGKGEPDYSIYNDPDTEESRSYEFYEKLTEFLNIRENSPEYQLEGKYTYKFNYTNPYGIEVREKSNDPRDMNKEIESGPIYYLKSDQFGFSRPSKKHKHPYDSYLEKSSYSETSKVKVAEWLYNTRSLGGSFLWPMEQKTCGGWDSNPKYNTERGGTKFRRGGSYIEDRVDLTLLEIKQVMDYIRFDHPELEGNILWKCCMPETNMVKWLRHFGDFRTYVEFFKFDKIFVDENNLIPYDITTNKLTTNKLIETKTYIGENRPRTIWTGEDKDMDEEQLGNMFNNVAERIKERSKKMEDIVNETEEE